MGALYSAHIAAIWPQRRRLKRPAECKYHLQPWVDQSQVWWATFVVGHPHPSRFDILRTVRPQFVSSFGRLFSSINDDAAMALLSDNPKSIAWEHLASNPHPWAVEQVRQHVDANYWLGLARPTYTTRFGISAEQVRRLISASPHPIMIEMLQQYAKYAPHKIDMAALCANTHAWAMQYVRDYLTGPFKRVEADHLLILADNRCDDALHILLDLPHISSYMATKLVKNPNRIALEVLRKHNRIEYWDKLAGTNTHEAMTEFVAYSRDNAMNATVIRELCKNPHPIAVDLLRKCDIYMLLRTYPAELSLNSSEWAINLMRANPGRIQWFNMSLNPAIIADDYDAEVRRWFRDEVAAELIAKVWHPRNMAKFAGWGIDADA